MNLDVVTLRTARDAAAMARRFALVAENTLLNGDLRGRPEPRVASVTILAIGVY